MSVAEVREPTFWILTVLAGGRRHGYALIRETSDISGGRVTIKVATLYSALDRLQSEGSVAADGDEVVEGRLRRYFRLTDHGASVLESEVSRLESSAREARKRLSLRPAQ